MHAATPDQREQRKNEERTATGIVIQRNYDSTGTLRAFLLATGEKVNRAQLKVTRGESTELKRAITRADPHPPPAIDEMISPIPD
jgi:hypothetical protein